MKNESAKAEETNATKEGKIKKENEKPGAEASSDIKDESGMTLDEKREVAESIILKRVLAASGMALLPFPIVDIIAITGIQLETVKKLSELYQTEFKKDLVKSIMSSLVGSTFMISAAPLLASVLKFIPFAGQATAIATMPIMCGATTYAIGKVFARHFEVGGTLLTFDTEKVREYYEKQLKKGKAFVHDSTAKKEKI